MTKRLKKKFYWKTKEYRRIPHPFHKASIILLLKSDKDTKRKDNHRPISPININAEIINKILANQIQEYFVKITDLDQIGFSLHAKIIKYKKKKKKSINVIQHFHRIKDKNYIISTDVIKALDNIQHLFLRIKKKSLNKLGLEGVYLNVIKTTYKKAQKLAKASIILIVKS